MSPLTLACLGSGVMLLPGPSASARRLRPLGLATAPWSGAVRSAWRQRCQRRGVLVAVAGVGGGAAALGASLVTTGPSRAAVVPALAGVLLGVVLARVVDVERSMRQADRAVGAFAEAAACLAEELRAGARPAAALLAVAGVAGGTGVTAVFRTAAAAAAVGGDVVACLRAASATGVESRRGFDALAAAWSVSERTGAALADVVDRVVADVAAQRRQRQHVAAQLAGPRATAVLLACLPALGVGLGMATGARPLASLLGTGPGRLALLVGVCLQAAGVQWTMRIIRSAGGDP